MVSPLVAWGRRLQAIAQNGFAYGEPSAYDRERYEEVRRIAAEMLEHPELAADDLESVLAAETGHATPKLDVRGVVFRGDGILLARERDDGMWTLPGGWVDVGESPSEAVAREVREETGYETRVAKLLALYDRDRRGHPPHPWHIWKAFFLCDLVDGKQEELSRETSDAGFFGRDEIPELSLMRVTPRYIDHFFEQREHPEWPADFD
jgi:ADP-ribose pyrophosphatase YjhB (NUDIX family)